MKKLEGRIDCAVPFVYSWQRADERDAEIAREHVLALTEVALRFQPPPCFRAGMFKGQLLQCKDGKVCYYGGVWELCASVESSNKPQGAPLIGIRVRGIDHWLWFKQKSITEKDGWFEGSDGKYAGGECAIRIPSSAIVGRVELLTQENEGQG